MLIAVKRQKFHDSATSNDVFRFLPSVLRLSDQRPFAMQFSMASRPYASRYARRMRYGLMGERSICGSSAIDALAAPAVNVAADESVWTVGHLV